MNTHKLRQHDADFAGIALVALLGVVGYVLAIHRPLQDSLDYDRIVQKRDATREQVNLLKVQQATLLARIEQAKATQEQLSATLPDSHALDDVLGRLHTLASQCDVVLTRLQPVGLRKEDGYHVNLFQIEGKAPFGSIHRWMTRIEKEVDYLDTTHFSIHTTKERTPDGGTVCEFECSQRFYISRPATEQTVVAQGR